MHKVKFLIAIFFTAFLAACNTIEGAGEDIQAAGEHIDEKAEEKKGY